MRRSRLGFVDTLVMVSWVRQEGATAQAIGDDMIAVRRAGNKAVGPACDVCAETIKAGEPVAWTWARRRIHEPYMPAWLVSSRRPFGAWVAQAVPLRLQANGGQLCTACLALGFSLSLEESTELATICAVLPGFPVLPVRRDTCGRRRLVMCRAGSDVLRPR